MPRKKKSYFTKTELRNKILNVGKHEHEVFMPNEIFVDLINGNVNEDGEKIEGFFDGEGNKVKEFASSTHIAYAYAYVYLAHYMYRYCKYYFYEKSFIQHNIDEKLIKKILGFPPNSDTLTYITKKNGLLHKLGYIRKVSDIPIEAVLLNDEGMAIVENYNDVVPLEILLSQAAKSNGIYKISHFVMESQYRDIYGNTKNKKINFPPKAFYRDIENYDETDEEDRKGTFWYIENTHMIDIDVFIFCMIDEELGVEGFYLYCFFFYMNEKHIEGVNYSYEKLVSKTGLGIKTVRTQLDNLEKRNMITNDHKPFCLDKKDSQITKTNTYGVLPFSEFITKKDEYKKIPKQRRISAERYEREIGFVIREKEPIVSIEDNDNKSTKSDGEKRNKKKRYAKQKGKNYITDKNGIVVPLPF